MNRDSISISNLHDGVTLTANDAEEFAHIIQGTAMCWGECWPRTLALEIANILRGKRRDGSEPGDQS